MENIFRIELNIFGLLISLVAVWLFYNQIKIKSKENKLFLLMVYFTITELILDSIFWLIDDTQFLMAREINILVNTCYYSVQILNCYVWMRYCKLSMGDNEKKRTKQILLLPLMIGVGLLIINLWNGCVFTIDANNIYHRSWGVAGTLEMICCVFYSFYSCVILLVNILIKRKNHDDYKEELYFLIVSQIPIVSMIIQILIYGLNFIWVGMAMALLLILVEIEVKQYHKKEQELSQQKINILLSQIQPHFLYNCLGSIRELCRIAPDTAEKAIIDFSKYLRGNMDSLGNKTPIPFERELEHVNNYLALEKLRYGDALNVEFDLQVNNFYLPALTIQPIMENAIKYGINRKKGGGTVLLKTEDVDGYYIITIQDDGVGFDADSIEELKPQHDGRSHIGLSNVSDRIEYMCNGTMHLFSKKDKGTTVTITIPKGSKKNEHIGSR